MNTTIYASEINGSIYPPCSKSYAQRAIAAALFAHGESVLHNIELCDDTLTTLNTIKQLGAEVTTEDNTTFCIKGGFSPTTSRIDVNDSGLVARMFSPIVALRDKPMTIFSSTSGKKRRFDSLINPLNDLGVELTSKSGLLPLRIKGPLHGGETTIDDMTSSQFLTGLLIALPIIENDTVLHINELDSMAYVKMTLDTIERFGGKIEHIDFKEFFIHGGQKYMPVNYAIEGDWSCASFWLVAGAVAGEVTVNNMNMLSLQADTAIIEVLSRAGAEIITTNNNISVTKKHLNCFEFDASHHTDLFPILTVLAANCEGTSIIKGVDRLFYSAQDRGEAIMEEFPKLGINITITDGDKMVIKGGEITGGHVSSRNDHRIAMAQAIAGLTSSTGICIESSEAVTKSYPTFWDDMRNLTTSYAK